MLFIHFIDSIWLISSLKWARNLRPFIKTQFWSTNCLYLASPTSICQYTYFIVVLTKGLLWVSHTSGIFLSSLACSFCLSVCLPACLPAYHLCIYLFCVLWLLPVRYEQMSTCSIHRALTSAEERLVREWVYCDHLLECEWWFTCGAWRARQQLHCWKVPLPRWWLTKPTPPTAVPTLLESGSAGCWVTFCSRRTLWRHCEPCFRDFLRLGSCLLPKLCKFCSNEPLSKLACFNMKEFLHHNCLLVHLSYVSKRESQGWCLCFVHLPPQLYTGDSDADCWVNVSGYLEVTLS